MSWYSAQQSGPGARVLVNYQTLPPTRSASDQVLFPNDPWVCAPGEDPWLVTGARVTSSVFQAETTPALVQTSPVTTLPDLAQAAFVADTLSQFSLALWRVGWWGLPDEAAPCLAAIEEFIGAVADAAGRVPAALVTATNHREWWGDDEGVACGSWGESTMLLRDACDDVARGTAELPRPVRLSIADELRAELAAVHAADLGDLTGRAAQALRPALTADPTALPALGRHLRPPMPVVPAELVADAAWTSPAQAYRLRCSYRTWRVVVDRHGPPPGQTLAEDLMTRSRLSVYCDDWRADDVPSEDRLEVTISAPDGEICPGWQLRLETLVGYMDAGPVVTLTLPADADVEQVAAFWLALCDPQFVVRCYYKRDDAELAALGVTVDEKPGW